MKNMFFATAISLLIGLNAHAIRETGGQHTPMKTQYQCYNQAVRADAPLVSILVDLAGSRAVEISSRGTNYVYNLTQVSSDASGMSFEAQNITAKISDDAQTATVTLMGLQLTYICQLVSL